MGIDTTLLNDKNKAKPKPKTIAGFEEEVRGCEDKARSYTILTRRSAPRLAAGPSALSNE